MPANVEDYLTTATRNKLIDAIRQRASASRKHDRFAADFAALQRHDQDTAESQAID
jgi:DNA-directed RNA polymerase specialized sigma24 family protein